MKSSTFKRICLYGYLAVVLAAVLSCTTIINDATQTVTSPTGTSPATGASPDPAGCTAAVKSVRVNPFGYDDCPGNKPSNSSGLLPLGCVARVTATPKDALGKDVPASVHGQAIAWSVMLGSNHIQVTDDPEEGFNKNVRGTSEGEFSLAAQVCGVTGSWNGRVVP